MLIAILVVSTLSQEEQIHEFTPEEPNIEEINEGVHQIVEHSTEEHKDDQIIEHHVNVSFLCQCIFFHWNIINKQEYIR